MKRLSLPIVALLLGSCGNYDMTGSRSERVGEILPLASRQLTSTDRNNLSSICDALKQKELILPSSLNTRHSFSTTQTDCEGNAVADEKVEVVIQSGLQGLFYKRLSDGQDFMFAQIETSEVGFFKDVCSSLNTLTNPVSRGNDVVFLTTTGIIPNDCAPRFGEVCVKVDQAFVQGEQAIVHTKDWLRIRVSSLDGSYLGFVTQRKKVTRSYCGTNKVLSFEAQLETN